MGSLVGRLFLRACPRRVFWYVAANELIFNFYFYDDYVMTNLFSFGYDLLQSFYSICKSFLLASFMNENKIFHLKKKKKLYSYGIGLLCIYYAAHE